MASSTSKAAGAVFDGVIYIMISSDMAMFRIANERQNHITDASVKVHLVMDDPDTGYREFTELLLERSESPLFALSWAMAHDLDSKSPMGRLGLAELKKRSAELIVSFRGCD